MTAIHPKYRQIISQRIMQHMQHMPVAAKGDDVGGIIDVRLAVSFAQRGKADFGIIMIGRAKMELHGHAFT